MEAILSDPEGLNDRKLIIYSVTPIAYKEGISIGKWIRSEVLYDKFHQSGNSLEVVLIGLDGRVKHRADTLIPLAQIYSWIDAMPMRMEELRRQEEGKKD